MRLRRDHLFLLLFLGLLTVACSSEPATVVLEPGESGTAPLEESDPLTDDQDDQASSRTTIVQDAGAERSPTTEPVPIPDPDLTAEINEALDELRENPSASSPEEFTSATQLEVNISPLRGLDDWTELSSPEYFGDISQIPSTDCASYDTTNQITGIPNNELAWQRGSEQVRYGVSDVGNAVAVDYMAALERIVVECPQINLDGGFVVPAPLDVAIDTPDDIVAMSLSWKQSWGGRVWASYAIRQNLIYTISYISPEASRPTLDLAAFTSLAQQVVDQATLATPAQPVAPTNPIVDLVDEPEELPEDLVALLLDEDDLGPEWIVGDTSQEDPFPSSDEDLLACPELAALDALLANLGLGRDFAAADGARELAVVIGRTSSSSEAANLVESGVQAERCLIAQGREELRQAVERGEDENDEFVLVFESIALPGAEAASILEVQGLGEGGVAVFVAVDDVVGAVIVEGTHAVTRDEVLEYTDRFIAKIPS